MYPGEGVRYTQGGGQVHPGRPRYTQVGPVVHQFGPVVHQFGPVVHQWYTSGTPGFTPPGTPGFTPPGTPISALRLISVLGCSKSRIQLFLKH